MANTARKVNIPTSDNSIYVDQTTGMPTLDIDTGEYVKIGAFRFYSFTTAITANSTPTTAPAGSLAKTTHATGQASLFVSDGVKWQYLTNA